MKNHIGTKLKIGLAAIASLALAPAGKGQAVDSLLNKLVEKGVLTQTEAKDLKEQVNSDFSKAYQVKTGLPDWVTSLKLTGDVRGRFEGFYADAKSGTGEDLFKDRPRFRYRARLGLVATLVNDFEAGVRLSSSEPQENNFGGDPISGNTTFQNNASYKFVFLDRAYGKWSPKFGPLNTSTTIGKMENPFQVSEMVFDFDYSPEGIAQQFKFAINDANTLSLNLAGFVLDELGGDSDDPYLLGAQLRWNGKFTPMFDATVGLAAFLIDNEEALTPANIPNIGRGNRPGAQFNPIYVDAGFGITLQDFPAYRGSFPIRVTGEYLYNPAMDDRNQGFGAGFSLGKSGKKGTWEVSYKYKYIGADAWFDEFVDSDFGVLRPTVSGAGTLTAVSYASGTNVRGHVLRAAYSPSDAFTLGVAYSLTRLIDKSGAPDPDDLETGRLQVDALWRF
ncbi:MAG TPA: putative porin [Candidatus Binatia bacterium]|nr:putative porin [Candidatus Binatia bacterium]